MWADIINNNTPIQESNDYLDYSSEDSEYMNLKYKRLSLKRAVNSFNFTGNIHEKSITIDDDILYVFDDGPYGWEGGNDRTIYVQNAIKRFRLRKLKSPKEDTSVYYGQKATYFLWRYIKNPDTGEEALVKPSDEICQKLREINHIPFEPCLMQPDEFW